MKAKKFNLTLDGDQSFTGYCLDGPGNTWNGFMCPWFTLSEGKKIIEAVNEDDLYYDEVEDCFCEKDHYGGHPCVAYPEHIDTVDGMLYLYPIGNQSWAWNLKS